MAGNPNWPAVALQMHFDALRSGKAIDSSTNALDASLYGTAALSSARSLFGGKSLHADGSSTSYAEAPSHPALCPKGIPWTLEIAFYAEALNSTSKTIISKRGGGKNEWMLIVDGAAGSVLRFYGWAESTGAICVNIATTVPIATGNWYRAAVARNAAGLWSIFHEGHLEASATESTLVAAGPSILGIGRDTRENALTSPGQAPAFPERNWQGNIEEVRITSGVCLYSGSYELASDAFLDYAGQVSGIVTSAGVPAQRVIRAYRRDTGAKVADLTSDPATGAYSFNTQTLDELNVLCLDDSAGALEYDKILRVMPA